MKEGFWNKYVHLVKDTVVPYQWEVLNDRVPDIAPSHAIQNFRIAAGLEQGEFYGMVFQDSDVAKWIEAVGYSLQTGSNEVFESWVDEVVEIIEKAQQDDGYLNTFFTVKSPGKRWTNLLDCHELYCAGHMIEAAVSYYNATGKRKLLDAMCRFADYIASVFGTEEGKLHGYDGHEEIELALVKLYKATDNEKYLSLSKYFVDERGKEPNFLLQDWEKRAGVSFWNPNDRNKPDMRYNQAHIPVREQTEAVGHAVRAVYLYTAMADLAALTGDEKLAAACRHLWNNIIRKQMYITGGIGSTRHGEAFTFDYDLPNDTVYQETCASIGLVFFAHRMLQMEENSVYADVMERALYNSIISGMGSDGKSYFYVNPMEVVPEESEKNPDRQHIKSRRQKWYACACCPPNLVRLILSLNEYIYSYNTETLYTHLYIPSQAEILMGGQIIKLEQESNYPWDGRINMKLSLEESKEFELAFRIPDWCTKFEILINGQKVGSSDVRNGYAILKRIWSNNDTVTLNMEMAAQYIEANPNVRANARKLAIQRGPLVYCLEEADNGNNLSAVSVLADKGLSLGTADGLPEEIVAVKGTGVRTLAEGWKDALYKPAGGKEERIEIKAVPYYLWGNRQQGEMTVWIRKN